ncbi:MAG: hypothetical protein OJF49_001790 [Ktedonobacterales bacterium]|jgi:hypothetical protein|nr:MAG: hypothetical protein OJF49_001790 [Ktedonobacterales bacterium]
MESTLRTRLHDLTLDARHLLTTETTDLLEGVYGLHRDGRFEPADTLPAIQQLSDARDTRARLERLLADEKTAGLTPREAVAKLTKEVAYTWLNRVSAFKMLEARKLIKASVGKGQQSGGFMLWLTEPGHEDDYARYESGSLPLDALGEGPRDTAYRHYLLHLCAAMASQIRALFDPTDLPSRLCPRPRALASLLALVNAADVAPAWADDETIGWIYQYFNEQEKAEVFARLNKGAKITASEIPAATQLFTPRWIVRALVENSLGRLWLQMHPDSRLRDSLTSLVPEPNPPSPPSLGGKEGAEPNPPSPPSLGGKGGAEPNPPSPPSLGGKGGEGMRSVREMTLLDPACGTMHFGLVAFDLFAAMYQEEIERAGEPGWPATPPVPDASEIPAAIVEHNLFGIDIDLRAVQLSALTLYLKAAALNPHVTIRHSNLACADVLLLNGKRLDAFIDTAKFSRPIYERVIRAVWQRLRDANQLGSLLRLEDEIRAIILAERQRFRLEGQGRLPFPELRTLFEEDADDDEYWGILEAQIVQAFDEFARQQAREGIDQAYFAGEAVKGMRLLDVMLRRYDVVAANPPYMGSDNMSATMRKYLEVEFPASEDNLYAAFIDRCAQMLASGGRLAMITQQSFMFISSYEALRDKLRHLTAIETMIHVGPRAFAEIDGEIVNTTLFVLRAEPDAARRDHATGRYIRLVREPDAEAKRRGFERAVAAFQAGATDPAVYAYRQRDFDAIPGSPWVYQITPSLRSLFANLPKLVNSANPRQGLATSGNSRFLRFWWEVGISSIGFGCTSAEEAWYTGKRWFPHMKGGEFRRWWGNQEFVIAYDLPHFRILSERGNKLPSRQLYFHQGLTFTDLTSKGLSIRYMPAGFLFDHAGNCIFSEQSSILYKLLGILNSSVANHLLAVLNPTFHFYLGDLKRLPIPTVSSDTLRGLVERAIALARADSAEDETTYEFVAPPAWPDGLARVAARHAELAAIEREINEEVYRLYDISPADRAAIEADLSPQPPSLGGKGEEEDEVAAALAGGAREGEEEDEAAALAGDDRDAEKYEEADADADAINSADGESCANGAHASLSPLPSQGRGAGGDRSSLAARWVSYAVGIALGRFSPGILGALGNGVAPLPAPDGTPPAASLAITPLTLNSPLPVGEGLGEGSPIAVLDPGHPDDLAARVTHVLEVLLGDDKVEGLLATATGGRPLHDWLAKDFFKDHHKRYRKRPIYWLLQSPKRGYGVYLFAECVTRDTLHLLRGSRYLGGRIASVRRDIAEQRQRLPALPQGAERRRAERALEALESTLNDLEAFDKALAAVTTQPNARGETTGWAPELDDGILINLAPLHTLMPAWSTEPRQCWQALERGDYDWSRTAMRYWPDRVLAACRANQSYAIAQNLTPQPPSLGGKGETDLTPQPPSLGGKGETDLTPQPPSLGGKGETDLTPQPPSLGGKGEER